MDSQHFVQRAIALGALLVLGACGGRPDEAAQAAGPAAAQAARAMAVMDTPPGAAAPAPAAGLLPAADADPVARLTREVAQLRREVSDLRRQMARGGVVQAEAPPPHPRADPEARAEAERSERMRIAGSEQDFRNQAVDPRFSQGAVASVRAALAETDESLRGLVRSVECRAQSCRVEISSDNGPALQRDLPLLVNRLGSSLPNVTAGQVDQGDGRQATVLYLSR